MSECVVRMEMPKNCYECEMRGAWAFCPIGKWHVVGYKKQRHEDCPIICQLPERHGRLGDLDELAAGCDAPYLCRWLGEIEDAQTIVPAEAEKSEKMKYRKKPVVIEAYQTDKELDIETLEGTMHASVGDYIITGVRGEQYPCKPDIFEQTYEPADTPASPWHRTEEPPRYGDWVLCLGPKGGYYVSEFRGVSGLVGPRFHANGRFINATHWMPLPEPPGEE